MDFNAWIGVAGVAIAAFTAIFAITGPLRREKKKELSFGILQRSTLLGATPSILPDAKMLYKGEEVDRLTSVTVAWMNTGQVPIPPADFERHLTLHLTNVKHLFSVELVQCSPAHLRPNYMLFTDTMSIQPMLLNPTDFVILRLLVSNTARVDASLEARILGVPGLHPLSRGDHPGYQIPSLIIYGFISLILALAAFSLFRKGEVLTGSLLSAATLLPLLALYAIAKESLQARRIRWLGRDVDGVLKEERIAP
ncbi:hypothetical protein [Variovorax sp. PMC12]|uniref:hypothetical protein n=1 Tax=Variovorax sp. PMC12 TaxID=2126319 RepID=UPI000D11D562|nr:hypothetical protein [Variovorax sp. PMC12]AVQ80768.1 hypothetical protein C4F17_07280 [Variovorax sp. PMC12]